MMMLRKRQRGMSIWGLMMMAVILGGGTLLGLKLLPVYMEGMKIDSIMKSVLDDPAVAKQTKREILGTLIKRLDLDAVESVNESNWKQTIKISKTQGKVIIQITYRKEVPMVGNLSAVADFDKIMEN